MQPNNITLLQLTELHKPLELVEATNASSKDTTSTMITDTGNVLSLQPVFVDERHDDANKFDGRFTFTSADKDLQLYFNSVYQREQSGDAALQNVEDPKDEVVTIFQNKLLSQDADGSYDNSDDRDALAIAPNKDISDSQENSANDNLSVSDRVTPTPTLSDHDSSDGDVIPLSKLNKEELADNNPLLLEVNRLCRNINIGDITHESVILSFNEYFVEFNRQFKQLVCSQNPVQSVICLVVQTAYKLCVDYILEGPVMKTFNDSPHSTINQLPKAVEDILLSRNKLEAIFKPCLINNDDHWELLKTSYSYLLCISKARSLRPFIEIQNQTLAIVSDQIEEPIQKLIEQAVHVTWDMVTLVPPAILAQPPDINEEWHEIRTTYWNDSTHNPLIYFKPVLFYSALGQVACKGEVGNVLRSNAVVLHHQEPETRSQQSSENISHEAYPVPDLSIMLNEADDEISNQVEKNELQLKVFHSVSIKTSPPAKISYAPEYEVAWRSCSNCGANAMISDRSTCEHCNNSAPDYLAWSILTLLCCFWPFSILALVYSMETRHHNASSNYKRASKSSKMAMIYNYFSFFTGILLIIILTMSVAAFLVYCALY
ncbi:PREDICTED: uncharacterized protein LOC109587582 [Amphimedon queenslandica]|uniref:Uncharacterized protein n=1 Tax=Amphimedon queenslandica TaxID=400682 RepID=A0AAN0JQQ6_AMPQE|nr:PREDICTED: uncharacterized protein LOC109587582 [Amphimedon queenslandica]|eukprot:XP_019859369.1 PREDICTED: uncharacterized protein LOC109587582 [Amphimedon queenslandica]